MSCRNMDRVTKDQAVQEAELLEQISRMKMELVWIKDGCLFVDFSLGL